MSDERSESGRKLQTVERQRTDSDLGAGGLEEKVRRR